VAYYKIPKDADARGWAINMEDNLEGGDDIDYSGPVIKKNPVETGFSYHMKKLTYV
jgi:hypothetical protein